MRPFLAAGACVVALTAGILPSEIAEAQTGQRVPEGRLVYGACLYEDQVSHSRCVRIDGGDDASNVPLDLLEESSRGTVRRIGDDPYLSNPLWAPDGRHVVVSAERDRHLWVVDTADGTHTVIPTSAEGHLAYAQDWSRDGQWLLVTIGRGGGWRNLYKVRADGTRLTQLTSLCGGGYGVWGALWTEGGKGIVWWGTTGRPRHIDVIDWMSADGTRGDRIAKDETLEVARSADGKRIAYSTEDWGEKEAGEGEIFVMGPRGEDRHAITHDLWDEADLTFSPDGRHLVYSQGDWYIDAPWHLEAIDLRTGDSRPLWNPEGADLDVDWGLSWAPNGEGVAYMATPRPMVGTDRAVFWSGLDGTTGAQMTPYRANTHLWGWLP
jgi:hypothetical protein